MRQTVLVFLGVLFLINLFFRMRIMKLMTEIKKHQLRIELPDLLNTHRFKTLTQKTYPSHAELLTKYRRSMMMGIILIIIVVISLTAYILIRPS